MTMPAEQMAWLATEFLRCRPWLQAALDRDVGTHTLDDVWHLLATGPVQLWPTPNAAMVTVVEQYPQAKLLRGWLSGGSLREIQAHEPIIRAFGEREGCSKVLINGRRGWLGAFDGYREVSTTMVRDI